MKSRPSRGLFPHARGSTAGRDRSKGGGSAGNSAGGGGNPTSGDGYKLGMLGWRSSRQAGGQSLDQKVVDNPQPTDRSLKGVGGLAWDKSADQAMGEPNYPPPNSRERIRH